jgi:hypothetical protein
LPGTSNFCPLEVDETVALPVTAALVTGGDLAAEVATASRVLLLEERLLGRVLGDLGEVRDRHLPECRRCRLE